MRKHYLLINGKSHPRYTVATVAGCRILHGEVPASDVILFGAAYSPLALADGELAEKMGATLVIGEPEQLAELREIFNT
jgi:hypothetical protein